MNFKSITEACQKAEELKDQITEEQARNAMLNLRGAFDAEPVSTTPSCSMTIDDIQIFLDRMPASVWRAYLAADAVDLATTLSGMLSISDAFGHIKSFADLTRLAIWMECEGFADDEMMEAS